MKPKNQIPQSPKVSGVETFGCSLLVFLLVAGVGGLLIYQLYTFPPGSGLFLPLHGIYFLFCAGLVFFYGFCVFYNRKATWFRATLLLFLAQLLWVPAWMAMMANAIVTMGHGLK